MTTTIVKDSVVGDQWIAMAAQSCPVQRVLGADGQPTGDILTGPVRLAFTDDLWDGSKPDPENPGKAQTFSAMGLFTPYADMTIFYEEYYKALGQHFASAWNAQQQQYYGVHSPFHDQAEKSGQYMGFTPGCVNITFSTQYKPPIVDGRGNPIVDKSKIYPGAWAILGVKPYPYGLVMKKSGQKKGIGFGLQSVMLIADDTRFGGGGPADTRVMYAGVNLPPPPPNQSVAQNLQMGGAPSAPPAGIPGYTAPGGGVINNAAPQPQYQAPQQPAYQPPQAQPQQQYQPPMQQPAQQPQQNWQPPQQQAPAYQPPMQPQPGFQQPPQPQYPTAQAAGGVPMAPNYAPPATS